MIPIDYGGHADAFTSRDVDAVVTFEPVRTQLIKGGANQVFDSNQIPGEIIDVMAVTGEFLRRNSNSLGPLIKAWFRAVAEMRQDPVAAATQLSTITGLTGDEYKVAMSGLHIPDIPENRSLLNNDLKATLERMANLMMESELLTKAPNLSGLVNAQPLNSVAP